MPEFDLRQAFNAVSDVVVNRPSPLREFDQIYMKISDMLLQAELLSRWLDGKRVVFVGDGDAIALTLVYLRKKGIFERGPDYALVLDFDERVVNSISNFAKTHALEEEIEGELYNVVDPLPTGHIGKFGAFYTNPPFGASNGGKSVEAFVKRGDEALGSDGVACVVVADDPELDWTKEVMRETQSFLHRNGYVIGELLPRFHRYHLDDDPDLTSCSLMAVRQGSTGLKYSSEPLGSEHLMNFYGALSPLTVRYVRDQRKGGALPSMDHWCEVFPSGAGVDE